MPPARELRIDLNCDMGEAFGAWVLGEDAALMESVTSANIACGYHAGDPLVMRRTVRLARDRGVAAGAHPGFPDLAGFGRRAMQASPDEIEGMVLYQLGALAGIARGEGVALRHVKPHGALYNVAARDGTVADAIVRAVRAFDPALIFYGLAGSLMIESARAAGLQVANEVFADRAYEADGRLASRAQPGAVIHDPDAVAARAVAMVRDGSVTAVNGAPIRLHADTICIHGDTPGAAGLARTVRRALESAGIQVSALHSR